MAVNNVAAAALPVAAAPIAAAAAAPVAAAAATPAAADAATPTTPGDSAVVGGAGGVPSSSDLPSGSSIPNAKIKGGGVTSVGDPHETTGDGMKFDNMRTGVFVKQRAKAGDFELQTKQEPWDKNPQATVNTAAAIKVNAGGDIVKIDAGKDTITFNGKPITVKDGETFEIPGGGNIKKTADGYAVTSAAGDKVGVKDRGTYMDVVSEASPDRVDGDITGSLGALDSDADFRNDLVGRDGQQIADTEKFLDEWAAKGEEDMFAEKPLGGGAPVDPAAPAVDPNAPVAADPNAPAVDPNAPVAADPNAPAVDPAAPAAPVDNAETLKQIRDLMTKLKADPAMAGHLELLGKIEALLGPAEGGEAQPQADLKAEAANAKPEGNADMEKLLQLIMQWLEALQKKEEPVAA